MFTKSKYGLSLPVVLITMALATLVGTALYRLLSNESESSGSNFHQSSAVSAAKAGLEATKAWLTFHSVEAKGALEAYRDGQKDDGVVRPLKLNVAQAVAAGAGESFTVYLTDIYYVKSSAEVSIKVQVIGKGRDGALAVLTSVLKLDGMVTVVNNVETPLLEESYIGDEDAIYVSGNGTDLKTGGNIEGDFYVGGTLFTQTALNVSGNMMVAGETFQANFPVVVKGDAYFTGRTTLQSSLEVQKGMRTRSLVVVGSNSAKVGTGSDGGDFFVDTVYSTGGGSIAVHKNSSGAKGNTFVRKYYESMNGTLVSDNDVEFGNNAKITYSNGGSITAGDAIWLNTANVTTGASWYKYSGVYGFYALGSQKPTTTTGSGTSYEGPIYGGLTIRNYVTRADSLQDLTDKLNASIKKEQPYELNIDSFYVHQRSWTNWKTLAKNQCGGTSGNYNNGYALHASEWNCIYEFVAKTYPELMNNGYLYVNLKGIDFAPNYMGVDDNSDASTNDVLTHNFVFYLPTSANPLNLFPNTSDSRVIWWLAAGGGQTQIIGKSTNRIYGIVYTGGQLDVGGKGLRVNGQILTANGSNVNGNGGPVEATFDSDVLNDLASQTNVMVGSAINKETISSALSLEIAEFYPLAPTLRVRSIAESMTDATVDTTNQIVLGPGVVFLPSYAIVEQGDSRTALKIIEDYNVRKVYTNGATEATCPLSPTSTSPTPPWNTTGKNTVSFNVCGNSTHTTTFSVYVKPSSDVKEGYGVASFKDVTRTIDELTTGDAEYEFTVLLNVNKLDGDGQLKFTTTGTATVGSDFDLVSASTYDIPSGTSTSSPITVKIKVHKDATNDEPDETIYLSMTSVGNSKMMVASPSVVTINLRDLNYSTQKLSWSNYSEQNTKGSVTVTPNLGNAVLGAPGEWSVRKNAAVLIEAMPKDGYEVAEWGGVCATTTTPVPSSCTISSMDADKAFSLTYRRKAFSLTVMPRNPSGGSVDFTPTADSFQDVGTTRVYWYASGTLVSAKATANTTPTPGYRFMGWTKDFAGRTQNPLSFSMDSNTVIGAAFGLPSNACFYDTYDGTLGNWWKSQTPTGTLLASGNSWYSSGSWTYANDYSGTRLLLADSTIQLNGEAEAKIKVTANDTTAWQDGIVLRANTVDGSYVSVGYRDVPFQQNHILFCHKLASTTEVCTEHANEIDPGAEVDLKVRALESSFLISINGVLVATVQASGHDVAGKTGLIARRQYSKTSFAVSTFKWIDGAGCSENNGNSVPEISNCRLVDDNGVTDDPLVVHAGDRIYMRADVKDADKLVSDAVRFSVVTTDGFAVQSQNVVYFGDPTTASINQNLGVHKGVGTWLATLLVKDRSGGEVSCEKTFKVVDKDANTPPKITGMQIDGATYTGGALTAGVAHTFKVTATDAEQSSLTYEWSGDMGTNVGQSSAGSLTWTMPAGTNGTKTVYVTVRDGVGGVAMEQLTLKFTGSTNSAPVITSCSATPNGGEVPLLVSFYTQAYDPDGDELTYKWSGGDGVNYSTEFPTHTFTAASNHDVKLTVTDSKGASTSCNLTISTTPSTNKAPTNAVCTASQTTGSGGLISVKLTGSASDPDGDPVNFRWVLGNGEQVWGNPYTKVLGAGVYNITGIAVDSKGAETRCAPIKVTNVNTAPSVVFLANTTTGDLPLTVKFTPTVTDKDGDNVTTSWSVSPSGSGCSVVNDECTFTTAGSYTVKLTATDDKGATASYSKVIVVTQNSAPTVSCSASPASPMVSEDVTWTAIATDADGDPLTALWEGAGIDGYTTKSVKKAYSTTGTQTAKVTVSDGRGGTATATCNVTVVAYLAPCDNPSTLTTGVVAIPANKTVCFAAAGASNTHGKKLGVRNKGTVAVTVKFWGETNENNTNCKQQVKSLSAADAWGNNGGNIDQNNAVADKTGNKAATGTVYVVVINSTSSAGSVNFETVSDWQNGNGCTTDDPAGSPDKW